MVPDSLVGKYAWADEIEGWTVAVMRRRPVDEVVAIYGGDPSNPIGDVAFADMNDHRNVDTDELELFVQVLTYGEHTVTIEQHGWSGALPEIARRTSADSGWFFSVYWNIHAAGFVTQAIDGVITARFESLYPFGPEAEAWEVRPSWALGPEIDVQLAWQVDLALLEQQTGVEVEARWLREPLPTYRVPEPYWLYRGVAGADQP